MIWEIEAANALFKNIPVYLSRTGLRIWERSPDEADRLVHRTISSLCYWRSSFETVEVAADGQLGILWSPR